MSEETRKEKMRNGKMERKRKALSAKKKLPRHRAFVGFVFVSVVLIVLAWAYFIMGYAVGRDETFVAARDALVEIEARWNGLKASGAVASGVKATTRITGVVSGIGDGFFFLAADPVSFELFSDEPRVRKVVVAPDVRFMDIAADGSLVALARTLRVGDRLAVYASSNIRTASSFTTGRIERYGQQGISP